MDTPPPQKKGLGPLAWIGIGCGGIVAIVVLGFVIFGVVYGPKLKKFAEDAQKDPTRAMATTMVNMSAGTITMVAEDEPNKRYTVKDKNGKLTTIYWNEKKKAPDVVPGDFSAIPTDAETPPAEPGTKTPSPAGKAGSSVDESVPK